MDNDNNFSIVHIHPTLNCNLRCLHCYSNSEPHIKLGLELDTLLPYLKYLKEKHSFNVVSISGGEPFLYSELKELLRSTKEMGYYNQLVSNGMLLKSKRNIAILEFIDSIALSIDGNKTLHNHIRGSDLAYDKMLEGAEVLNNQHIPFGFIHTVTKKSWKDIPDLIALAKKLGAEILQLHPIEGAGRAMEELNDEFFLDDNDLHRVFILSELLKESSSIKVHLDLLHRHFIQEQPQLVFGNVKEVCSIHDLMKEIIITEKGEVLPISYGFSNDYLICNLNDTTSNFETSIEKFIENKGHLLKDLLSRTYENMLADEEKDLFNWSEIIVNESRKIA